MFEKGAKKNKRGGKKNWNHKILTFSGFALLLFFLFNLSLEGFIVGIPFGDEIFLFLLTVLTVSFFLERGIKFKNIKIYEIFYTTYLAFSLLVLTVIYWITYIKGVDVGIFRTLIVLSQIIIFLYSLITIKYSGRFWFIVVSYVFTALVTIILFAYIYWTISLFGLGYLQFNNCQALDESLSSQNWFYFSSVTFYALGYGEICPILPLARFVSQLEVAIGALINTILIGFIFWKVRELSMIRKSERRKYIKV